MTNLRPAILTLSERYGHIILMVCMGSLLAIVGLSILVIMTAWHEMEENRWGSGMV